MPNYMPEPKAAVAMSVRIPAPIDERLRVLAKKSGYTRAEIAARLIAVGVEEMERQLESKDEPAK